MAQSMVFSVVLFLCLLYNQASAEENCTCLSYGVDFQDEGSYFQNISSTDAFTFVSLFEGCEADTCNNILVDPSGDEYQCSDTDLTPDDENQMSTCPIDKDEMYSGDCSVILISNNGDGCPIAYERDFYLTVGVPLTTTYTPTVTLSSTVTPITNTTSTEISTSTVTTTATVTSPARTIKATTTVTPHRVTTTKTITIATISKTAYTVVPTVVTTTIIQTCRVPPTQQHPDPRATYTPSLVYAAALATTSANSANDPARRLRRVPIDQDQRIAERKARLAGGRKEKRGLDVATVTVTDTDTSDFLTTTSTIFAPTSTLTITAISVTTTTSTTTSTSVSGVTVLSQVTKTAPTPTKTLTRHTIAISTVATITKHPTVSVTIYTAPPQSTTVCRAKGGKLWPPV